MVKHLLFNQIERAMNFPETRCPLEHKDQSCMLDVSMLKDPSISGVRKEFSQTGKGSADLQSGTLLSGKLGNCGL
jgi:hypothetical protein